MKRLQNSWFRKVRMIMLAAFIAGSAFLVQAQQGPVQLAAGEAQAEPALPSAAVASLGAMEAPYSDRLDPAPQAATPDVDPEAVKVLRRMTDYVSSLKQFSVHVRNLQEEMLEVGHRADFEMSVKVLVSRPNKVRADRVGHLVDQSFYYDGTTLTLSNPSHKLYATAPAPATIEETIDFSRETLGVGLPVADLVYRNAFPLLMQDVNLAGVVGKEVIEGVTCTHVLFIRPGVDFQVWVADGDQPLPYKYVVTDTGTRELLSTTSLMSDWNVAPGASDAQFTFVPPPGAKATTFLPLAKSTGQDRR